MQLSNLSKTVLIILHSCFLIVMAYFVQSTDWIINGDEKLLADGLEKVEHNVLHLHDQENPNRYLFLNTSKSKMLIPAFDKETGLMPIGNESITDRSHLLALLKMLDSSAFTYLILDVFMDAQTPVDQELERYLFKLGRTIIPFHLNEDKQPVLPVIKGNMGLSDVHTLDDVLYKYRLVGNNHESIPLKMYQDIYQKDFNPGWWLDKLGDRWVLNDFVLNFRIRNYNIWKEPAKWNYLELGEFLQVSKAFAAEKVKDRIIVVGDFKDDTTNSITGTISGPLVLLNAFLSLEKGDAYVSGWFVLYLFLCFSLVTIIAFDPYDWLDKRFLEPSTVLAKLFKSKSVRIFGLITLISIVSYVCFGIFVSIFFIALYAIFMDKVTHAIYQLKLRKGHQPAEKTNAPQS